MLTGTHVCAFAHMWLLACMWMRAFLQAAGTKRRREGDEEEAQAAAKARAFLRDFASLQLPEGVCTCVRPCSYQRVCAPVCVLAATRGCVHLCALAYASMYVPLCGWAYTCTKYACPLTS